MPRKKSQYSNISLPTPLVEKIKRYIEKNSDRGYTSVSDFVKHATIEKLEKYMHN